PHSVYACGGEGKTGVCEASADELRSHTRGGPPRRRSGRPSVAKQFPDASWQRCWTHFMRSALGKVSHKDKDVLAKDLCGARQFEDRKTCLAEAERVAQRWDKRYPRVAAQIRAQFEETLAVHGLPRAQRRRVYTTNMLERLMREIKRRIRVVGIFPNAPSCDRLVGAQLVEIHESWQCERTRYITFEHVTKPLPNQKPRRTAA
ncbi:MAG TPA: transposase, partial [Candidatus Hydrogenedentes bacterium]|nr:transposase [Candidatus Hydrogenedentota bacterium]